MHSKLIVFNYAVLIKCVLVFLSLYTLLECDIFQKRCKKHLFRFFVEKAVNLMQPRDASHRSAAASGDGAAPGARRTVTERMKES